MPTFRWDDELQDAKRMLRWLVCGCRPHVQLPVARCEKWLGVAWHCTSHVTLQGRPTPTENRIRRSSWLEGRIRTVGIDAHREKGSSAPSGRMASPTGVFPVDVRLPPIGAAEEPGRVVLQASMGPIVALPRCHVTRGFPPSLRVGPPDPPSRGTHVPPVSRPAGGRPLDRSPPRSFGSIQPGRPFSTPSRLPGVQCTNPHSLGRGKRSRHDASRCTCAIQRGIQVGT